MDTSDGKNRRSSPLNRISIFFQMYQYLPGNKRYFLTQIVIRLIPATLCIACWTVQNLRFYVL
jgi:hypothetical protein